MSVRPSVRPVRVRPSCLLCFRRRPRPAVRLPARQRVPGNKSTLIDARFRSAERVVGHTLVAKRRVARFLVEHPDIRIMAMEPDRETRRGFELGSPTWVSIASAHRTQHFIRAPQTRSRCLSRFAPGVKAMDRALLVVDDEREVKPRRFRRRSRTKSRLHRHPVRRLKHVRQAEGLRRSLE